MSETVQRERPGPDARIRRHGVTPLTSRIERAQLAPADADIRLWCTACGHPRGRDGSDRGQP
ncbi:hypothetical protein [Streptacidiphilus pinicola]|uniref:hypothetical protein n=1 Tax=Streptacidiphilus pinicola TaxID=2219663 RepID=UPI003C750A8B